MSDRPPKQDPSHSRAVERQMRNWSLARQQRTAPHTTTQGVHDFIAISRAVGCDGDAVAHRVGELVHWPVFDRQVHQTMAGNDEIRRQLYSSLDGRDATWIEDATTAFLHPDIARNDYFRRLVETTFSIARGGHAVFVGRGADLILPRELGLRVRIAASRDACVAAFAAEHGLDANSARKEVERLEKERAEFIRHHFRVDATDLSRFDLGINLDHLTAAQAAELVVAAYKLRAHNR